MRTKDFLLLLTLCAFLLTYLTVSSSIAEVKYLGTDWENQGDWIGKYGADGAIIFCNEEFHNQDLPVPYEPSEKEKKFKKGLIEEISITSSAGGAAYGWIFDGAPGDDKRAPWLVDESSRFAGCVSGRNADVGITLKVNSTDYKVTIYCTDYDTTSRVHQIYGYQGEELPDEPDEEIDKYTDGVHASWEVTGDEPFRYFSKNGAGSVNSVASALFVDGEQAVEPGGKLSTVWGRIKNFQ